MKVVWISFLLVIAVTGIGLGVLIAEDPGVVSIRYSDWQINTTLWVAVLAAIVTLILVVVLSKLVAAPFQGRRILNRWLRTKRSNHVHTLTVNALESDVRGDTVEAIRSLIAATESSDDPVPYYMWAIALAERAGEPETVAKLKERMVGTLRYEAPTFSQYEEARKNLKEEDIVTARRQLVRLLEEAPTCAPALVDLIELHQAKGEWTEALMYLNALERLDYLDSGTVEERRVTLWSELLSQHEHDETIKLWGETPNEVKEDPAVFAIYTEALIQGNQGQQAIKQIERYLKKRWYPELLQLYTQLEEQPEERLKFLEERYRDHTDDPALLWALGEQQRKLGNENSARLYLEKSRVAGAGPRAEISLLKLGKDT